MHDCRTLCIFLCTDRRKDCGDTGSDILSHDDRDRCRIADCTGLQSACKYRQMQMSSGSQLSGSFLPEDQAPDWKFCQHSGKCRYISKWFHCFRHGIHTIHQHCKADQDRSDIMFFSFLEKAAYRHQPVPEPAKTRLVLTAV